MKNKQTHLYMVWAAMKCRCLSQSNKDYRHYGARGISVYDQWMRYEPFHDWAMANGYAEYLTLERKNNDGDYEPSNCTWAPRREQRENSRGTSLSGFRGVSWHEASGKWYARVISHGKAIFQELYSNKADAVTAVQHQRRIIFGRETPQ